MVSCAKCEQPQTPVGSATETPTQNSNGAGKVLGIGFLTIILTFMVVVIVATLGNHNSDGGRCAVSDEERQAAKAILQKLTSGGIITRSDNTTVYVSARWHSLSRQQKVGLGACLVKAGNSHITIRDDRTGKEVAETSSSVVEIVVAE